MKSWCPSIHPLASDSLANLSTCQTIIDLSSKTLADQINSSHSVGFAVMFKYS